MKKFNYHFKFATILLVFVLLSCSDSFFSDEDSAHSSGLTTPETMLATGPPPVNDISAFYTASAQRMVQNFDLYIGRYGTAGDVYFNFEKLMRDEAMTLAPYFGVPQNFNYSALLHNLTIPNPSPGAKILPSQIPGVADAFAYDVLYYLDRFFGDMYDVTTLKGALMNYWSTRYALDNDFHDWGPQQYWQVRNMIEIGYQYATQHLSGRVVPIIEGDVYDTFGKRATGSCVNFKSAWQAGVLGGFAGGIIGGVIGGLGGSVVLPGVGTTTGAVGGAVYGFANGFVSGVLGSIAQDVIFNCLLGASRQVTSEQCQQFDFYFAHPEWCSEYYQDRKYWYNLITGG